MIFDIRYLTTYRYAGSVIDNMNALRVRPATTATQRASGLVVTITPEVRVHEHIDYFGTVVHEFEVARPHSSLEIDVSLRCRTASVEPAQDCTWERLGQPDYRDAGAEFLVAHEAARPHPVLDDLAQRCRGATPLETAARLCDLVPVTFEYRKGVTYVGSTVADLIAAGAGVCQDFVHVSLAVLRGLGIAARYCSGYYFTAADRTAQSAEVETHAWLEIMLPDGKDGWTWVGFDPTNTASATDCHVKIGHGRWYSDVPPIKGVFRGPPGGELTATVTVTLVDEPTGTTRV